METVDGKPYLPGAASLLEQLDKNIMLILRDGRHLVGILRSFDHFMNLTLEKTCERVILPGKYCDMPLGLYVVRGDNIVLLGEINEKDEETSKLIKITPEELTQIQTEIIGGKVEWDFES